MKKKIILIASFAESLINFRLHLMKQLIAHQFEVIVMAPYDEEVVKKLKQLNISFISIPLDRNGRNPFSDFLLLCKLILYMRRIKPDYVFSYTIKPVIYGSIAAKVSHIDHIYSMITGAGYAFSEESRWTGKIARLLLKFSLRFNKKIFFQNKDNLALYKKCKLISDHQLCTIVNGSGVDINHFVPVKLPKEINFLMVSRFLYDKGICEYIAAVKRIKKIHPECSFNLVGWIDSNPTAIKQEELAQWISDRDINYLGKLTDVREAIAIASVFVLPSYGEGTPRTVLEAMAMGRPIITTDVPGCRETVINQVNGILIKARDIDSLYHAMLYFIDHPDQIAMMGNESRKMAVSKYDVNNVNHHILTEMGITNAYDETNNISMA